MSGNSSSDAFSSASAESPPDRALERQKIAFEKRTGKKAVTSRKKTAAGRYKRS